LIALPGAPFPRHFEIAGPGIDPALWRGVLVGNVLYPMSPKYDRPAVTNRKSIILTGELSDAFMAPSSSAQKTDRFAVSRITTCSTMPIVVRDVTLRISRLNQSRSPVPSACSQASA
jgi:hypothetical protein